MRLNVVDFNLDLASRSVLVAGDGDFSFSYALARGASPPARLVATGLAPTPAPEDCERCAALDALSSISIVHGIDAQELNCCRSETFDCVVFNFPQGGRKIQRNRTLLAGFLAAAAARLSRDAEASVYVTLVAGQGGTPFEHDYDAAAHAHEAKNRWDIVDAAARAGLVLVRCGAPAFAPLLAGGYRPGGYRGGHQRDGGFDASWKGREIPARFWSEARTHVFARPSASEEEGGGSAVRMLWAPTYERDVAYWLDAAEEIAAEESAAKVAAGGAAVSTRFRDAVRRAAAAAGAAVVEASYAVIDEYVDAKCSRRARTVRLGLRSSERVAISRSAANTIADAVRHELEAASVKE